MSPSPKNAGKIKDPGRITRQLQERVKELDALHRTTRILQNNRKSIAQVARYVARMLPRAWQYPEDTGARVVFGSIQEATPNFEQTRWKQTARFATRNGSRGLVEVAYLHPHQRSHAGQFLKEERTLLDSMATMLASFWERRQAQESITRAYQEIERKFQDRTTKLSQANSCLRTEIRERRRAEKKIRDYQDQLKCLASELSLAEEKERRVIATELHDRIGQALAVIKLKFLELHCNRMRCQFQENINDLRVLLDQAIGDTRNLTFEISPPILYELGLVPALQWLAEGFQQQHHVRVNLSVWGHQPGLSDDIKVTLFKAAREFLMNAVKHAKPQQIWINAMFDRHEAKVVVQDNGCGLAGAGDAPVSSYHGGFGLFSLRERAGYFGGSVDLSPADGGGARATIILPIATAGKERKR